MKKTFKKNLEYIKKEKIFILNNRYILGEEIGRGGLSVVYKSLDLYNEYFDIKSNIVIKMPTKELLTKNHIEDFVFSEYLFLKEFNHDNIVKALDFGIDKKTNIPYLVLEYLEGKLLSQIAIPDLSKKFKINLFFDLYTSLFYIHKKGIIHADINPSNIIINENQKSKIFDFGISQYVDSTDKIQLDYKQFKGFSPQYCAPEILNGEKPSFESDIFSFAVMMYELFTLKLPYSKNSLELINHKFSNKELENIPFFLRFWFKKTLNSNPKARINNDFIYFLVKNKQISNFLIVI
ncbi:serine/threonine-protein kinase [Arcobacter sp.]|uniref:serine/threonine-protein kinase n=1 Tax=Arcobacter sp. TaxID=1872629 RepID=UPI003C77793E